MPESEVASMVVRLADASPHEAHDLVVANSWMLEIGIDETIGDLLTTIRRKGDGPRAERLERGRRLLRQCREYGAERALIREVLASLESLSPAELAGALQLVPAEDLQSELRRRIDGAIDIGDVLAWNHWLTVSVALEHADGPHPLDIGAGSDALRDEVGEDGVWATRFLAEHDVARQRAMLRDGPLPLPPRRLEQIRLRFGAAHLIAARERDALEVIHLRRSLGMATVAAEADPGSDLVSDVLTGRRAAFVGGYVA